MKIFAISDFHLCISGAKPMEIFGNGWENYQEIIANDWKTKVTENDVVLIAGDTSWAMKTDEAKKDFAYFEKLPGKKIFIRGNHDYWWKSISSVREILPKNSYALQNDAVKIGNFVFCGTRGWTIAEKKPLSAEDEKIYKREVIRLELALLSASALAENGEQIICLIHFPPFNSTRTPNEITALLKKYNVSACVYGHLHGSCGKIEKNTQINGIKYYLTSCDQLNNKLLQLI